MDIEKLKNGSFLILELNGTPFYAFVNFFQQQIERGKHHKRIFLRHVLQCDGLVLQH